MCMTGFAMAVSSQVWKETVETLVFMLCVAVG